MQDHGRSDDRTFRISWAARSAQKTRRTTDQRKISISAFLLYALKFIHEFPTPSSGGDTNITRGLPRMTTSLDILLTRPLRTLETKGATYRHKTLSKTGRTSRPYASVAMVFLFTRQIILNTPRISSFDACLRKKDSEGSAYRIPPMGEAVRLPKSIKRLGPPPRYEKQRIAILMQVTPTSSQTSGSEPRTDTSGRSFSSLIPPR